MNLISVFLGSSRRCSLCHRGKVVGRGHFCQGCRDHLWSLHKRRVPIQLERLKAELSGAPIPEMDPALQASHGDTTVIDEISRALNGGNSKVRELAAYELALLNNPLAVDPLGICLVKHHSSGALTALTQLGDIRAAGHMYEALNADDFWWQPRQEKMGVGDHISDDDWVHITVFPYRKDMVPRLRTLGGQKLVIQTFVRLAEDPNSRRRDVAVDALLQFARDGGAGSTFKNDPESREMMIDAAHNLARGNAMQQAKASQILNYIAEKK